MKNGFSQVQGVDYDEGASLVFRYESLHMLFTISASHSGKWDTRQSDIKHTFLHEKSLEEGYIKQLLGYEVEEGQVTRLSKTLYGLKQSLSE